MLAGRHLRQCRMGEGNRASLRLWTSIPLEGNPFHATVENRHARWLASLELHVSHRFFKGKHAPMGATGVIRKSRRETVAGLTGTSRKRGTAKSTDSAQAATAIAKPESGPTFGQPPATHRIHVGRKHGLQGRSVFRAGMACGEQRLDYLSSISCFRLPLSDFRLCPTSTSDRP